MYHRRNEMIHLLQIQIKVKSMLTFTGSLFDSSVTIFHTCSDVICDMS